MRFFSAILALLKGWLFSALAFGLLAAVQVGQSAWAVASNSPSFSWQNFLTWQEFSRVNYLLPWAFIAPFLFFLVAWLPLFGARWYAAVPAQLAAAVGIFLFCSWWSEAITPLVTPARPPGAHGENHWPNGHYHGPDHLVSVPGGTPTPRLGPWLPRLGGPPGGQPWRGPNNPFFVFGFRLPIYLAIMGVAHALGFYRRSQVRERHSLGLEASLARARLEALRSQLQPHFLFDSLNAIAALIHKDPEAADEMVAALSDFLRLTLESSSEQELPLHRELLFVERYLAIEKVRFGDRLRFSIDTPAETLPALVPTLVLQPLVENAVRHGLEPKLDGGTLTITARHESDQLILTVLDDGAGLHDQAPREGIGLFNTRARLCELYGAAATLDMSNGAGVRVRIALPFHTVGAAA